MTTLTANPATIQLWAARIKCFMCKHRKDEAHILPKGKFWPSPKWMFHYQDTHGLPHEVVAEWIYKSVYEHKDGKTQLDTDWAGFMEADNG